jgi:hypothetical protein
MLILDINQRRPLVVWQAANRGGSFQLREVVEDAVKSDFMLLVNAAAVRTLIGEGCRADWMSFLDFNGDDLQTTD